MLDLSRAGVIRRFSYDKRQRNDLSTGVALFGASCAVPVSSALGNCNRLHAGAVRGPCIMAYGLSVWVLNKFLQAHEHVETSAGVMVQSTKSCLEHVAMVG